MTDHLDNETEALRHAWHAVAISDEIPDGSPVQVWLLGEPWAIARLDGELVAVPDRCPHRLAPLSAGTIDVIDGRTVVRCGYHGWCFDRNGTCVEIPSAPGAPIPSRARLSAAHGVMERHGLVWLAPEQPLADVPAFPEWDDPDIDRALTTVVRTNVSAAQLVDNFLDASHFPFVHADTFGTDEASLVVNDRVERDEMTVRTTFATRYRDLMADGSRGAVEAQSLLKEGGPNYIVRLRLDFPAKGSAIGILFCCTPETADRTCIRKLVTRNDLAHDPQRLADFVADEDLILAEDLRILERYRRMEVPLDRRVEVHTKADRLSLAWRDLMAEMVETLATPATEKGQVLNTTGSSKRNLDAIRRP